MAKKRPPRLKPKFNYTPATFPQLQNRSRQIAMSQIQPQLSNVDRERRTSQQAHDTRGAQIQGIATWQQGNLDKAFGDTRTALNNLVTLQGGVDQQSKDALAAALRRTTGSTADASAALGATPQADPNTGILDSASDAAKSAELSVGSGSGALLGFMGAQRSLPSVGLGQFTEQERQRFNAQDQGFAQKRQDVLDNVPNLQASALQDLRQFELAKAQFGESVANRYFQQYLSEQELGLKRKDQTFQQWLARQQIGETKRSNRANEGLAQSQFLHSSKIDWANVGINRAQVEAQFAQINADAAGAKDKASKEKAKARGAAMAKGMEWLSGYMAPGKGQSSSSHSDYPYGGASQGAIKDDPLDTATLKDNTTTYQRKFDDALRGLTRYTSRSDALRILASSEYSDWRDRAKWMLQRMKRRGRKGPIVGSRGGTQAPGANGQTRPT